MFAEKKCSGFFVVHEASPHSLQAQIEVLECIYPSHSTFKKMGPHNKSQLYIFECLVCTFLKNTAEDRFFFQLVNLLKKQNIEQVEAGLDHSEH